MTMEQKIKKIELEYDLYDVSEVEFRSDVVNFLFDKYNHLGEVLSSLKEDKRSNDRNQFISMLLGKYRKKNIYFKPSYYDKNRSLIELGEEITENYRGLFYVLLSRVEINDFEEVNKLARFTYASFVRNYKGVCRARSIIKTDNPSLVGINKTAPIDFEAFIQFFNGKLGTLGFYKPNSYVKR